MFCVIYRWRLKPGTEDAFVQAWRRLTRAIRERRGGLGSRLHRGGDGLWVAYAQWPDRAAWEAASLRDSADPEAAAIMADAVAERLEPIAVEAVADLLVRWPGTFTEEEQ
jgi:heme-degrading monooxygenase HmoA